VKAVWLEFGRYRSLIGEMPHKVLLVINLPLV